MQNLSHLAVLIHEQAKTYGDREVLIYKDFGGTEWKTYSWNQFSQTQFMITDAKIRILFVGEQEQYDKAHRVQATCHTLERIIVFDRGVRLNEEDKLAMYFDDFLKLGEGMPRQSEVEALQQQASMDDIANILYTSGTTGDSKGVILTCGQYHAAMVANGKCVPVTENDRVLNFLPFTHIFEKGWKILCLTAGARLIVNTYPQQVQQTMKETHPTCMSSVPRFWEKVYMGVQEKIETSSAMQRKIFEHAIAVGRRHNIDYLSKGKKPPMALHFEYEMLNKTIFWTGERPLLPHGRCHSEPEGGGVRTLHRHQHGGGLRTDGVAGHRLVQPPGRPLDGGKRRHPHRGHLDTHQRRGRGAAERPHHHPWLLQPRRPDEAGFYS